MIYKSIKWFVPILLAVCFAQSYGEEEVLDRIVAVVDDEIILLSELKENVRLEMFQRKMSPEQDQEQVKALEREILDGMIADQILLAKAKDDSILVKQKEIDEVLQEQLARIQEQLGSEEEYQRQLEQSGITERDLKKRFRREIRNYLMKQKMLASLAQGIVISGREVEAFYETYKDSLPIQPERVNISHILIRPKVGGEDQDAILQKAREILAQVRAGADFGQMAKAYSQDTGSAQRGGDLGYFKRGTMLPEFERVAFALRPGEISDIVRTRLGYHIIRAEDRKGDEVRVRHILWIASITEKDEQEALDTITQLRERALSGEDFAQLARTFSDDETTASKGGALGWIPVERLPADFKPVVDRLQPGEISQPIPSASGYHLIRLNEREKGGAITLRDDRALLENFVRQEKIKKTFEQMIAKERERIYVDVRLE